MQQSKHYITDLKIYENSFKKGFTYFYGDIKNYTVLALLPSYLEREGSSLIYMANDFIRRSNATDSGFYLHNLEELSQKLMDLEAQNKRILLIGVSYALLDLLDFRQFRLKNTIIMETGGMKGQRKEMVKEELHKILCKGFGVKNIHSEYGMTELLSQSYSQENGFFEMCPWMDIQLRDVTDPFSPVQEGKTGGVNVIDLANIHSCSFVATEDLGRITEQGFELMGRFDNTDVRGCNQMVL
jgi:hypothetical protein